MRHLIFSMTCALFLCTGCFIDLSAEETKEKKDSLHDLMEAIGDDYKAIYKVVKKKDSSQKEAAVKALDSLKNNCEKSKNIVPHKAAQIKDEAEKKKFIESYKKEMDVLIGNIEKLKKSVEGEDWDAALAIIKTMKTHKGASHDKFQDDEDHDH